MKQTMPKMAIFLDSRLEIWSSWSRWLKISEWKASLISKSSNFSDKTNYLVKFVSFQFEAFFLRGKKKKRSKIFPHLVKVEKKSTDGLGNKKHDPIWLVLCWLKPQKKSWTFFFKPFTAICFQSPSLLSFDWKSFQNMLHPLKEGHTNISRCLFSVSLSIKTMIKKTTLVSSTRNLCKTVFHITKVPGRVYGAADNQVPEVWAFLPGRTRPERELDLTISPIGMAMGCLLNGRKIFGPWIPATIRKSFTGMRWYFAGSPGQQKLSPDFHWMPHYSSPE